MPSVNNDDSDIMVTEVSSQLDVVMVSTESSSENNNFDNDNSEESIQVNSPNGNSEEKNSTEGENNEKISEGNVGVNFEIESTVESNVEISSDENSDHKSERDSARNSEQNSNYKSEPNSVDYEVIVILSDDEEGEMSSKSTKRTDRSVSNADNTESARKSLRNSSRNSLLQKPHTVTRRSSQKFSPAAIQDSSQVSSEEPTRVSDQDSVFESSREPSLEPSRKASSSLDLVKNTTSNHEPDERVNDSSDSSDFFASDTPVISQRLRRQQTLEKKPSAIPIRQSKRKLSMSSDSSDIEILSSLTTTAPKKAPATSQESNGPRLRSRRTKPEEHNQTRITNYFTKTRNYRSQSQGSTSSRMSGEMADLLAVDSVEAEYFSRLDRLDLLKKEEIAASNNKAQAISEQNSLKTRIRKDLTSRLSILGPESLLEPPSTHHNIIEPIPYSTTKIGSFFDLEQEIEEAITQRSEESEPDVDFFFLTPYFKPQSYAFSSKAVFKGWYTFLKYADSPNEMIESGLFLDRIKAHPENCISFSVWLWILRNIPQSSISDSARDQYLQVLTQGLPKLSRENLLQTIYALFAATGANTTVILSLCNRGNNSESKSISEDLLASCHLPVSSTKHYFFPQGQLVDLVLEAATTITVKNDTPELILPVLILVLLVSIDASLLYTITPLEIPKHLEALFNAVPSELWDNHMEPNKSFWYSAACLICRIIPTERFELRYRLLESLKNASYQRVHHFRQRLATVMFQQATSNHPASVTISHDNDLDRLVEYVLIPALADPGFFDAKLPTFITAKLQFLLHALHNLPDISVDLRSTLLSHLEPELAKLKRSLRLLSQESLVQVSVLDTIVASIRTSIPSYDVYAE